MELDSLLSCVAPEAPLQERLEWLVELFRWISSQKNAALFHAEHKTEQLQTTRIRYLLIQLNKDTEKKLKVASTLRSILFDTSALDLFCTTGLPAESGFVSEVMGRMMEKLLPRPPHEDDLGEVFVRIFSSREDIHWLERLEESLLSEIWALLNFGSTLEDKKVWTKLREELKDAILFLAGQVRAFGLAPKIRLRMSKMSLRQRPFFAITAVSSRLLKDIRFEKVDSQLESLEAFRHVLAQCRLELKVAYKHLDIYGVSVSIVYQLDRIESLIKRMETLLSILLGKRDDSQYMIRFICLLITELKDRESFRSFFDENLSLMSMKIAEQSAATGEHYIARTSSEYRTMFMKAAGGGVIAGAIAFVKTFLEEMTLAYFIQGIFKSVNYSVGFLGIYMGGYTLATRQPAMTANALAAKMHDLEDEVARSNLVDEVAHLIRSQGAAIFGNVMLVVPTSLIIFTILYYLQGSPLMSEEEAMRTLKSYSAFGLTPVHAAFTGFLLWASSVIAGWVSNWSVYHEIPQALSTHRRLKAVLGPTRLNKWIATYKRNLSGWVGYIALGFLLGMSPKILGFFGVPIDVRHVTISSGTISFASASLGWNFIYLSEFWWAFAGILLIGIMNVGVSFFMALIVALKARRVDASLRDEIYSEVFRRFKKHPSSFLFPQRDTKTTS